MNALAFLFDVDNTLIDNDGVKQDLADRIRQLVGEERAAHFWSIYEQVRRERDYVDFPLTLERFQQAFPDTRKFANVAALVLCYPYSQRLYPRVLEVLRHAKQIGAVGILSDGDPVFQPAKIARAGLPEAVDDNLLIFAHKEQHLDEVRRRLPAKHYVLVDDKPKILAAVKDRLDGQITTLHVCQGKYAHAQEHRLYPAADIEVPAIADLLRLGPEDFLPHAIPAGVP